MARKKWKSTGTKGVRYYEHSERKHGVRKDRYFSIRYSVDGRQREEGLGWASEGWTLEKARKRRDWLRENIKTGKGPRTLKEAKALKAREEALRLAEDLTVSEFWEKDYLRNLKHRVKPSSWEKEVTHYEKRIKPLMGIKSLKDITSVDVEIMLDRMREEGLAPRTQKYALGTLYRIWKHAARRKIVKAGDNPCMGVDLPSVNNARTRVLTPSELQDILEFLSVSDRAAHDITLFCSRTGCRFSEAARLTWEHVDLVRGTAFFPETKNRDPRPVFLAPELVDMLERRGPGKTGETVFTRQDGKPYIQPPHAFVTAVKKLELNKNRGPRDRVSFHSLRHTAATVAARRGVPIKDLQAIFGWRTPAMIFRYVKGNEETQRAAMMGVAKALNPEPAKVVPMVKGGKK